MVLPANGRMARALLAPGRLLLRVGGGGDDGGTGSGGSGGSIGVGGYCGGAGARGVEPAKWRLVSRVLHGQVRDHAAHKGGPRALLADRVRRADWTVLYAKALRVLRPAGAMSLMLMLAAQPHRDNFIASPPPFRSAFVVH